MSQQKLFQRFRCNINIVCFPLVQAPLCLRTRKTFQVINKWIIVTRDTSQIHAKNPLNSRTVGEGRQTYRECINRMSERVEENQQRDSGSFKVARDRREHKWSKGNFRRFSRCLFSTLEDECGLVCSMIIHVPAVIHEHSVSRKWQWRTLGAREGETNMTNALVTVSMRESRSESASHACVNKKTGELTAVNHYLHRVVVSRETFSNRTWLYVAPKAVTFRSKRREEFPDKRFEL